MHGRAADRCRGRASQGNRTECALLLMLKNWGCDYAAVRSEYEASVYRLFGFSSAKKMASVTVKFADKFRHYNKGAPQRPLTQSDSLAIWPASQDTA